MKLDMFRLVIKLEVKATLKLFSRRKTIIYYRNIKITDRNFTDWLNTIWLNHKRKST